MASWILAVLIRPYTLLRGLLLASMGAAFALVLFVPAVSTFFAIDPPGVPLLLGAVAIAIATCVLVAAGWRRARDVRPWPGVTRRATMASAPRGGHTHAGTWWRSHRAGW